MAPEISFGRRQAKPKLADRVGHWNVVIACLGVAALLLVPQAFVIAGWQLIVLRFLMGVALGGLLPCITAIIRHSVPENATGNILGYSISSQYAGQVLGPLAGGFVGGRVGMRAVFLGTSVLMAAGNTETAFDGHRFRILIGNFVDQSFVSNMGVLSSLTIQLFYKVDGKFKELYTSQPGSAAKLDLERAMARLAPAENAALTLCYALGHSHGEAAAILSLPLGTVKSHVLRGREKLRAFLEDGT